MKFLLLLTLIGWTIAINMQCQATQQCPTNAFCQSNNMCACNTGYIGDCSTDAYFLSSASISLTLASSSTTLFYIDPQQLSTFIEFKFEICLNQPTQVTTTLTLWGQTGDIDEYNQGDSLGNPTSTTLTSGCQQFITPYISFGSQPNGQNQMLVFGIATSSITASISINATQQQIAGIFVYYYILIAIVAIIVVVIIVGVSVFLIRRRRRSLAGSIVPAIPVPAFNNIEHFQNFMPKFIAEKLGSQKVVCAICLQQIESNQTVRQTPCKHVFHSICIDSWCLKNLTCPVCRADLTLDGMSDNSRRSSFMNSVSDRVQFSEQTEVVTVQMDGLQPSVDVVQQAKTNLMEVGRYLQIEQGRQQIRQHML